MVATHGNDWDVESWCSIQSWMRDVILGFQLREKLCPSRSILLECYNRRPDVVSVSTSLLSIDCPAL